MQKKQQLEKILSIHFIKFSLIPILIVEVALLIMYFSINGYISSKNIDLLLKEAQSHSQAILENEANFISEKLNEISRTALILQNEHQAILANPNRFGLPNNEPSFDIHSNGVFYKTNKEGASLYYSANTKMNNETINKAKFTEAMDISLKSVVDINPNIVAAYFNTWDNMNRLYPFIDKVYEQYGHHINMEDYNFYYLANLKYNPEKKAVWTGAYLDPAGNGWMLSCIVPIYKNDFLEGVTGLDITIDSFVKNILNRKLPYNANLFMVDKEGMIIAMPEKIENLLGLKELKEYLYTDSILKTITKPEEFNLLKNKSPFASHFKNFIKNNQKYATLEIQNKEYLTLQQNVNETNWKLMILIDKSNIFSTIEYLKDLSNKIGYLAILFLLIFYILFFYLLLKRINNFSSSITKPIIDLSEETSKVTDSNNEVKILETDILEIYQLSNNFSKMIKELNTRTQKLYDAKVFAEEANKIKDEFLANMSHELKTPLNSINILSDLMVKNKTNNLDEKQLQNIEIINKCGKDLLYLINDILDLSKLDAKEIKINPKRIDIKQMVNNIFKKFDIQAKSKNINFILDVDESLDFIYSDEEKIKQIINNLLSNALKFTHEGSIKFLVEKDENNLKIVIEDQGIGIAKENLEIIFDRFKQIDGSRTRKYSGTGLGLSICKELCILLNIVINVKSIVNKGTTFELIIPKEQESNNNFRKKIINDKKESILVLNNDPISLISLITILNKKYTVRQTTKIEELIKLRNNYPDSKIVIDVSKLENSDLDSINRNFEKNIILLHTEDLYNLDKNIILESYKKPLKKEDLEQI